MKGFAMGTDTGDKDRCDRLLALETAITKCMGQGFPLQKFSRDLEHYFLTETLDARKNRFFIMGVIAIFIYNLFLITDREMLPDVYLSAWKIRLGIITPSALIILALMRYNRLLLFLDYFADILLLLGSSSIILILALSHHPNVVHYHTGVILIIMFGNIVFRTRFWHAFSVSWLTFVIYILTVTHITPMTPPVMINSSIVLFSAIIISLVANYQMENDFRWNYLRNLLKEIETIRLEKTKKELERLSSSDALTGIANRRHFDAFLNTEWQMAISYRTQLALIFLDVDDFKAYNDLYGHQAGDICLQKIAALIRGGSQRTHDLCARYGGEEFVVLLPNTTLGDAQQIAEKIRKGIEMERLPHASSRVAPYVTVSLGIASIIPQAGQSQKLLMEQADKALYKAKEMGRNQVQIYFPASDPTSISAVKPSCQEVGI